MLDHLLPLIYREYEYFDESNKENYGYVIRRRAQPVSSTVSTPSRTPPRPPRRNINSSCRMEGGVASRCSIKRRRKASDDGSEDRGHAKKQQTMETAVKEEIASRRSLKRRRDATDDGSEERGDVKKQHTKNNEKSEEKQEQETELVTPVKKPQEPKISAKKVTKKIKTIKKNKKQTNVKDAKQKIVKVSKSATPKLIPLQDITHLYVNEHTRSYEYQQRERFVAGLTTSVAIRFF